MIKELLQPGKENRVSLDYLKQLTGISSTRELRKQIQTERIGGAIILSCYEGGYYLPDTLQEVRDYVNTKSKEARSIFFMLKSATDLLSEYERGNDQHENECKAFES